MRRCIWSFLEVLFAFLFVDLFDNVGTLVGVCEHAGFIKEGKIPRVGRALVADAAGVDVWGAKRDVDGDELYRERGRSIGGGADGVEQPHGCGDVLFGECFVRRWRRLFRGTRRRRR